MMKRPNPKIPAVMSKYPRIIAKMMRNILPKME